MEEKRWSDYTFPLGKKMILKQIDQQLERTALNLSWDIYLVKRNTLSREQTTLKQNKTKMSPAARMQRANRLQSSEMWGLRSSFWHSDCEIHQVIQGSYSHCWEFISTVYRIFKIFFILRVILVYFLQVTQI